jgi:hypothetical protein
VDSEAAWRRVACEIWHERLDRRLKAPGAGDCAKRLVSGVHEALALTVDGRWTEAADRRAREAFTEIGEAVGIGAPPWR